MGGTSCEDTPFDSNRSRKIGKSNGGPFELRPEEMYKALKEMVNPGDMKSNEPMIELFDITSASATQPRVSCEGTTACPTTGRSMFANCVKMRKGAHAPMQDEIKAKMILLVEEQDKQKGGAFGGVYGTYTLAEADCGRALAYFEPIGGDCRMTGVARVDPVDGYWKTTWKTNDMAPATIEVTYNASGDVNLDRVYSDKIIAQHGPEGNSAGWHWMNSNYNMKFDLVARSTLNSLRVRNMKLRKGGDVYMLCGAHRLNFVYHQEKSLSADKCWGASTYDDGSLMDKMRANGLATPALFDPLGLVWILLWKKDNLSAATGSDPSSYYVCAAYMHPHFADLIVGTLPEKYNVCTATRWWSNADDRNNWSYNNHIYPNLDPTAIRAQMDQETDWVADKIRKPFFKLNEGEVELRSEVARALFAEESRAGTTSPLKWLIDVLKYVYFNKTMPVATTKPVPVTTLAITTGPVAGAAVLLAGSTNKPPVDKTDEADKTDDASKEAGTGTGTGTGTPVPTGTGTPAKEESFWDKNQYYIIGGIIVGVLVVILAIFAFIVVSRRRDLARTEASYEQLGESDQGYSEPGEGLEPGEGPEGLELEGPEGLEPGPEDPTRFGF